MLVTATLINLYHICHREMWLHQHEIRMEHTSDLVAEGRILHETSYPQRAARYRELQLPGIKIDQYDPHTGVVHEIKKSPKRRAAHVAQLKYYLWRLEQAGLKADYGLLEYPKQRRREEVRLTATDRSDIPEQLAAIEVILQGPCPERLTQRACRQCSYFDFCWSEEIGQD